MNDVDNLISLIEKAFNNYSLNDGVSLREAKGIDNHNSTKKLNKARELDEKQDWRNIPYKDIEKTPSIFAFLDEKGIMFYLPAFMIYIIKNHDYDKSFAEEDVIYSLSTDHSDNWFKVCFQLIEGKHKTAIVSFLNWYKSYDDEECYKEEVDKALEYWDNA